MCTICTSLQRVLAAEAEGTPTPDPTGLAGFGAVAASVPAGFTSVRDAVSTPSLVEGADAAAGTGTSYSLSVGGLFEGEISNGTDGDWVAVDLVAGESYTFVVWGINGSAEGVDDTTLTVRGSGGQQLAFNDDVAAQFDNRFSLVEYTASSTGTHYLDVQSYGTETGDYSLMAASQFFTIEQAATYMVEVDWGVATPFYFNTSSISVNITNLNADGQQLARWALEAWSETLGVTFVETGSATAQIRFDDNQQGAFAGPGDLNPNTGVNTFSTVNIGSQWLVNNGTTIDSYSYQTYLHEIGHALGLGHAGPYDGSASYSADAIHANDSTLYSVMSYFDPNDNPNVDGGAPTILTPMRADVVALQSIYGTPSVNGGDTIWGVGSNVTGWLGDLFGILFDGEAANTSFYDGHTVAFNVLDSGGTDLIDLSSLANDQRIDLRPGAVSNIRGTEGGMTIDVNSVIENVNGGTGDDTIFGNGADNRINGRGGNDTIDGLGGIDTAVFNVASNTATVTRDGTAVVVSTAQGTDRYTNVEFFAFNNGTFTADQLINGAPAGPTSGDDVLAGTGEADTIDALAGNDDVSGAGGNDTLIGGEGNDALQGGAGNDALQGDAGNDTLTGGSGDDTLNGGAGSGDLAVFNVTRAEATATLEASGAVRIDAGVLGSDLVSGVELFQFTDGIVTQAVLLEDDGGGEPDLNLNLVGTSGDDDLTGGVGNDSLFGQDGDDTLTGGAGNDLLAGSAGDDIIDAGDGNDAVGGGLNDDDISGGAGNDTIGAGQGDDTADGGTGNDIVNGGAGNDVLSGASGNDTMGAGFNNDNVTGGDGDDSLGGGTGRDTLDGGAGDDAIGGGEGDDTVNGGDGDDFLAGGGRNDSIDGGAGADRINGGAGDDFMRGGSGADLFIFNQLVSGEVDVILDFQDDVDRIRLSGVEGQNAQARFNALDITEGIFGLEVRYDGHQIDVDGLQLGDLTANDFLFT